MDHSGNGAARTTQQQQQDESEDKSGQEVSHIRIITLDSWVVNLAIVWQMVADSGSSGAYDLDRLDVVVIGMGDTRRAKPHT